MFGGGDQRKTRKREYGPRHDTGTFNSQNSDSRSAFLLQRFFIGLGHSFMWGQNSDRRSEFLLQRFFIGLGHSTHAARKQGEFSLRTQ